MTERSGAVAGTLLLESHFVAQESEDLLIVAPAPGVNLHLFYAAHPPIDADPRRASGD